MNKTESKTEKVFLKQNLDLYILLEYLENLRDINFPEDIKNKIDNLYNCVCDLLDLPDCYRVDDIYVVAEYKKIIE